MLKTLNWMRIVFLNYQSTLKQKIKFISTALSLSLEFLIKVKLDIIKIPSGEIINAHTY